jgi:glycolate oxidase FAD binding subunit
MSDAAVGMRTGEVFDLDAFRREIAPTPVDASDRIWRYNAAGVVPRCVVRPTTADGVAAVVRAVGGQGGALVPAGNATHLDIGFPPRRYDVTLCTSRLDRIVTHDAEDLTVSAEAGVTLHGLNAQLQKAGQWLPFDPSRGRDVTIGGLIASDRNGPLRLAHGKVRDFLIGLRVVMADGNIVRGGGKVVKNVAGYDLPKLFVGSFGTLGVIVEATFKVRPKPRDMRLYVIPMRSVAEATQKGLDMLRGSLVPVLLEAVNELGAETIGLPTGAALVVACAGSEADTAAQESLLRKETDDRLTRWDGPEMESLLSAVRDFPQPADEEVLVVRLSARPAELPALLRRIEAESSARRISPEIAAHAGNGVAWLQLSADVDLQSVALFAEWIRLYARQSGGWLVFETLPRRLRGKVDPWGFNGPTLPLMVAIKQKLDPHRILSPGRFVGGI